MIGDAFPVHSEGTLIARVRVEGPRSVRWALVGADVAGWAETEHDAVADADAAWARLLEEVSR